MPAPTLISTDIGNIVESVATSFDSAGDIGVQVGDLVVAIGVSGEPSETITFGGDGGALDWSHEIVVSSMNMRVSVSIAEANDPYFGVLTMYRTGTSTIGHAAAFYVFSGHAGHGNSAAGFNFGGLPSVNLTTTAANSAIVAFAGDNTDSDATPTWLTEVGPFTSVLNDVTSSNLEIRSGYHADSGAIGTYTVGHDTNSALGNDMVAIEIKGIAGPSVATTAWWSA